MSQTETWTIGRLLTWTSEFLKKHYSDTPRLDAELLLAHSLGCERIALYTRYEEVVVDAVRTTFRDLVKRRADGAPVAYLLGRREFYSLQFTVTADVLIPRPETEFAVIGVLDQLKLRPTDSAKVSVADVGTGSGAIAVAIAKYAENVNVTAIDISPAALAVATGNAVANGVADRITLLPSDLLAAIPSDTRFDIIVSNPPYVSMAEYEALSPEVKNFEPRLALVGGERGTEIIARLIAQAANHLVPDGWLIVEISPMIAEAVLALFAADACWQKVRIAKDLAQRARIVHAQFVS